MYKYFYCDTEVFIPDYICRHKVKTQMQVFRHKKINISYTQKNIIFGATELCLPMAALTYICGQRCTVVWSRVSVSSWKLRKNTVIGCRVTLRGKSASVFLEKLYIYGCFSHKNVKPLLWGGFTNNLNFGVPFTYFFELQKAGILYPNSFSGFYIDI